MELGLTIPLQRHLKIRSIPYGEEDERNFCWDLHIIQLNGRANLLAVHCSSRYTFTLYDLNWSDWSRLEETFLNGLCSTFQDIGIPPKIAADYLQRAGVLRLTKTHGRREVAYLNRAWEDVMAFDYALNSSTCEQPLLDHAVNTRPCRCAGVAEVDSSANRLRGMLYAIGNLGQRKGGRLMGENDKIQLFEDKRIRTAWDEEKEEWFFSVVDVVGVLTDSPNPNNYWKVLKKRLKDEGNESVTNCNRLKLKSPKDGKRYLTDVADTEQLLRIIQSIPSPKAEPFKMWLAQVGRERIEETIDPELTIDRALETYQKKGYSREWINQRLQAIQVRKELTDEWDARGVQQGIEYAILTDEISRAWSGMTTRQYKRLKGLKKENLRDNMTTLELVLNMLTEATTTELSKEHQPETFEENKEIARRGGRIAGETRKSIEADTGKPVITAQNATQLNQVVTDMIEGVTAEGSGNSDPDK